MIFRENSTFVTPKQIFQAYPITDELRRRIDSWRKEIASIIRGEQDRYLLIIGPCSIHNVEAAFEYATYVKKLAEEVQDRFFIIMRAYFEKPRTSSGWKGLLYDPHLNGTHDIANGIRLARAFLVEAAKLGVPCATEFLDPNAASYLADCISWGCIGARTSQSQVHRQLASALPMPVGFKNRCDGNVDVAIRGAVYAKNPHRFLGISPEGNISVIQGHGNMSPHIVLRGGEKGPNYDLETIERSKKLLEKLHISSNIIVDCSHDNSRKNHKEQIPIMNFLVQEIHKNPSLVAGFMLESFLLEGKQTTYYSQKPVSHKRIQEIAYGASLTDACLDWNSTYELIKQAHASFSKTNTVKNTQVGMQQCALSR